MKRFFSILLSLTLITLSLSTYQLRAHAEGDSDSNDDTFDNLVSFGYVFLYDSDIDPYPVQRYSEGIFKVVGNEDGDSVKLYEKPHIDANVKDEVIKGTYHVITEIRNDFGYITYKDKSGWIRMEHTAKMSNALDAGLVQSLNDAVELLHSSDTLLQLGIGEYTELAQRLAQMEEILLKGVTPEEYAPFKSELIEATNELNCVSDFIRDPNGTYSGRYRFYGDVNADNLVNMLDVISLQRYIANMYKLDKNSIIASDLNVDQRNDMRDVVTIQIKLAKFIEIFPSGFLFHTS